MFFTRSNNILQMCLLFFAFHEINTKLNEEFKLHHVINNIILYFCQRKYLKFQHLRSLPAWQLMISEAITLDLTVQSIFTKEHKHPVGIIEASRITNTIRSLIGGLLRGDNT